MVSKQAAETISQRLVCSAAAPLWGWREKCEHVIREAPLAQYAGIPNATRDGPQSQGPIVTRHAWGVFEEWEW